MLMNFHLIYKVYNLDFLNNILISFSKYTSKTPSRQVLRADEDKKYVTSKINFFEISIFFRPTQFDQFFEVFSGNYFVPLSNT